MNQKVELIGGHMDGMVTVVSMDQQEVILKALVPEPIKLGDDLYPTSEVTTETVRYRRRLKDPPQIRLGETVKVLSFDPGETTGWAYQDERGE